MKKIGFFGNSSASAQWRLEDPAKYVNKGGLFKMVKCLGGINDDSIQDLDAVIIQGCVDKQGIATLAAYQAEKGLKVIVEQDDQIEVDPSNPHAKSHEITDAANMIKITMGFADMVTTSTDYLADKLSKYNKNVVVLPNYMDLHRWDIHPKNYNCSNQIRIGWVGSITHIEDLKMVVPALEMIYKEYPDMYFVTVGDPRIKDSVKFPSEVMMGVPFDVWPTKLHSLRLDVAIAPLVPNEFNRCKSNIKSLEYGIAQYPGVYSPTVYGSEHGFDGKRGLIATDTRSWYQSIKNIIECANLANDIVDSNYAYVKSWYNLEKKIGMWEKAYSSLFD